MKIRAGNLHFLISVTRFPDCNRCTIPACGMRNMNGGAYDCEKKKIWDETKDLEKTRKIFYNRLKWRQYTNALDRS